MQTYKELRLGCVTVSTLAKHSCMSKHFNLRSSIAKYLQNLSLSRMSAFQREMTVLIKTLESDPWLTF
jgi:hypothetical protein